MLAVSMVCQSAVHLTQISGQSNLTKRLHRSNTCTVRQVAPMFTPCNTCFLGSTRVHIPNGISISSAVSAELRADSQVLCFTMDRRLLSQNCSFTLEDLGSKPPSNTQFLGPPETTSKIPSISWVIFAGLTSVIDWPTDQETDQAAPSETIRHADVCSTAMWPKNKQVNKHASNDVSAGEAGLAESNGSLLPGGWLTVTCGLTACTQGSAPGLMLDIEYRKAFTFS